MRHATAIAIVIFMKLSGVTTCLADDGWISFGFGGGFGDLQAGMLAQWINESCRPDEMGSISGFSYQAAPGAPVNLKVFCRSGGAGKLGPVKVVRAAFDDDFTFKMGPLLDKRTIAIVGFDLASVKAGGPTGTVVMVVKE